ncbi:MAG: DUF1772 domain-containing protein [Syntrophales bacterium]|nr:DUF1772 domain-containing protein [Syntrophales bacterium]MDD5643271.1 DUF1772 domain-containing protein [Syntrophales bacterium]
MQVIFELTAALAAGLFTGAALYIIFVEHPARLEYGPPLAVREFIASYRRAAVMQPSLAFLAFLAGGLAWWSGSSSWWLLGAAAMGSLFPLTIILMLPINRQLHDLSLEKDAARTMTLLELWGKWHRLRCLIGLGSFILFLVLLKWG